MTTETKIIEDIKSLSDLHKYYRELNDNKDLEALGIKFGEILSDCIIVEKGINKLANFLGVVLETKIRYIGYWLFEQQFVFNNTIFYMSKPLPIESNPDQDKEIIVFDNFSITLKD